MTNKKGELYYPAWMTILKHIGDFGGKIENLHIVSRELDITYSHLTKVINSMKRIGWLTKSKKGRTTTVILTKKGNEKYEAVRNLMSGGGKLWQN